MSKSNRADQRKYHVIYKTTCEMTGHWYIGMHSTDNLDDGYRGSGTRLAYSLGKYGKQSHSYQIMEFVDTRKKLVDRERELITDELISDPMCMNLAKGGGREIHDANVTLKARQKMSAVAKEMWKRRKKDPIALAEHWAKIQTPETCAKRAASNTGKKRTEETRAKMREAQEKIFADGTMAQKISAASRAGYAAMDSEKRALMRQRQSEAAKKRAPMSDVTRAKIALSNKAKAGKKRSPESRERMRIAALTRKK